MSELTSRSFNLRCRACHGEALYTEADTIDVRRNASHKKPYPRSEIALRSLNLRISSRAANG